MTPDTGEVAPLIDPDRPLPCEPASCRTSRRRNDRSIPPAPAGKTADEDVNDHIPTSRKQRQAFVDLPVLNSIRRTTPASRPYGRCAVGLRPSLGSDAYFDVPSQDQEAPKTSESKRQPWS
jgi:hypothetical protein